MCFPRVARGQRVCVSRPCLPPAHARVTRLDEAAAEAHVIFDHDPLPGGETHVRLARVRPLVRVADATCALTTTTATHAFQVCAFFFCFETFFFFFR